MEEHCRNLTVELARQGHTVHLLTTAHPDGRPREAAYGAELHYLPGTAPGDYSRAWRRESRRWARDNFRRLGVNAVLSMSVAAYGLVDIGATRMIGVGTRRAGRSASSSSAASPAERPQPSPFPGISRIPRPTSSAAVYV